VVAIAGAGTGKSRVIVERVGHLLRTQQDLQPENILVLTYNEGRYGPNADAVARLALNGNLKPAREVRKDYPRFRDAERAVSRTDPLPSVSLTRKFSDLSLNLNRQSAEDSGQQ
jgi:superfamily I DNA/RNA helicase